MDDRSLHRHRPLFAGLLLLIAWLPIPLGSNRPWSVGVFEAAVLTLLGVWLTGCALAPFEAPAALRRARLMLVALGVWCLYVGLQAVPLPEAVVAQVAPAVAEHYRALDWREASRMPLTLDRGATLRAALSIAAYGALLILVLALVTSRRRVRLVLGVIVLSAVANAIYGMLAHFTQPWSGLWSPARDPGLVTGTFVNRNHFGGLMALAVPISIGLVLTHSGGYLAAQTARARLGAVASMVMSAPGRHTVYIAIMSSALVLSTSRGALLALLGAVVLTTAFVVATRGRASAELRVLPWVLVCLVAGAVWFGFDGLLARLQTQSLAGERPALWRTGIEMAAQAPLTGFGAGAFERIFPAFKGADISTGYYDHLHNDLIELIVEQGVIGAVLCAIVFVPALARVIAGLRRRRDALMRGALFASATATTALMLHGLVDFNFHIPANAAYWLVLLGVGLVCADLRPPGRPRGRPVGVR